MRLAIVCAVFFSLSACKSRSQGDSSVKDTPTFDKKVKEIREKFDQDKTANIQELNFGKHWECKKYRAYGVGTPGSDAGWYPSDRIMFSESINPGSVQSYYWEDKDIPGRVYTLKDNEWIFTSPSQPNEVRTIRANGGKLYIEEAHRQELGKAVIRAVAPLGKFANTNGFKWANSYQECELDTAE